MKEKIGDILYKCIVVLLSCVLGALALICVYLTKELVIAVKAQKESRQSYSYIDRVRRDTIVREPITPEPPYGFGGKIARIPDTLEAEPTRTLISSDNWILGWDTVEQEYYFSQYADSLGQFLSKIRFLADTTTGEIHFYVNGEDKFNEIEIATFLGGAEVTAPTPDSAEVASWLW
jgi:hypothetical protein